MTNSTFEVLVATPTRIKSALQKKELNLRHLRFAIFDEADQLFDMGFKKDLDFIVEYFDMNVIQLAFITATLHLSVEDYIIEKFPEKKFTKIFSDISHAPQSRIETYNVKVSPSEKNMVVKMFLEKQAKGRGIIFTNQKNQAEDLFKYIQDKMPKLKVKLLHGGLEKKERQEAIKSFIDKKAQVLIATDVAARGIDIIDLSWVVNYGLPKTGVYYLHRCGRVARGGREGVVYNLVAPHDAKMITQINDAIKNQQHLNLNVIPEKKLTSNSLNSTKEKTLNQERKKKTTTFRKDEKKNLKGMRGKKRLELKDKSLLHGENHSSKNRKKSKNKKFHTPVRNRSIKKFR